MKYLFLYHFAENHRRKFQFHKNLFETEHEFSRFSIFPSVTCCYTNNHAKTFAFRSCFGLTKFLFIFAFYFLPLFLSAILV